MKNRILTALLLFAAILSIPVLPLQAEDSSADVPPNKGFHLKGIGICLKSPYCLVDDDSFKVLQLNVLKGNSKGFVGLQFGVINANYGTSPIQMGLYNQDNGPLSILKLGLLNRITDEQENLSVLQLGLLTNFYDETKDPDAVYPVYGIQLSGIANFAQPVDLYGLQLSGGLNQSRDVFGIQAGLDLHWLIYGFFSDKKPYMSRARSIYGIKFSPVANIISNDQYGLGISVGANEVDRLRGIQMALGLNTAREGAGLQLAFANEDSEFYGVQVGGMNSVATASYGLQMGGQSKSKDLIGVQFSLMNEASDSLKGWQLGLINSSGSTIGIQLGLINTAADTRGLQVGLRNYGADMWSPQIGGYNTARSNNLLQVGLVNTSENSPGVSIGLINWTDNKATLQLGLINFAWKNWPLPVFPVVNMDGSE